MSMLTITMCCVLSRRRRRDSRTFAAASRSCCPSCDRCRAIRTRRIWMKTIACWVAPSIRTNRWPSFGITSRRRTPPSRYSTTVTKTESGSVCSRSTASNETRTDLPITTTNQLHLVANFGRGDDSVDLSAVSSSPEEQFIYLFHTLSFAHFVVHSFFPAFPPLKQINILLFI